MRGSIGTAFFPLFICSILISCSYKPNLERNILSGISNLTLIENSTGTEYYYGVYKDVIIRLDIIIASDYESARRMAYNDISLVNIQYRTTSSPYPQSITNKIICPDELKPVYQNDSFAGYLTLYSTERLTYGACSKEIIKFNSLMGFRYCDNRLYKLRIYSRESFDYLEKYLSGIKC